MSDRDESPVTGSPELLRLVEECVDRYETDGRAAVDEICAENPQWAAQIRSRVEQLERVGLLETTDDDPMPERIGEYRLKRRLGRGGMGVVYVAEQTTLGRDVALKLIRPERLYFPGARERFEREVESIAKLQHPGIVKVYACGREADLPYFAMELVDGVTLAEVLTILQGSNVAHLRATDLVRAVRVGLGEDTPDSGTGSWTLQCCEVIESVAQSLEHAHQMGVLHRDVKPSNIMVTRAGQPMLLDFGLARTDGVSDLTQSGNPVGSLPYMAPEQLRGEAARVGPTTDVYALGATLQEMLTLQPAFHCSSAETARQKILHGERQPIAASNPGIAWEIETIVAKAMDVDPNRRYASAAEFADDIRRFLERRPILGRRASLRLRAWRTAQRNPARATALVLGVLVVVVAPLVFGLLQRQKNTELTEVLRDAKSQSARADENLDHALAAVEQMIARFVERRVTDLPQFDELARDVLQDAVNCYERIAGTEHSPRVGRALVSALVRIGLLRSMLGETTQASEDFDKAIATTDAENGGPGDNLWLARAWSGKARVLKMQGKHDEAQRAWRKSREILVDLLAGRSESVALLESLVDCDYHLAMIETIAGKPDEATARLEQSVDRLEVAAGRSPSTRALTTIARGYDGLANAAIVSGQGFKAALQYRRKKLAHLERGVEERPNDRRLRSSFAHHLHSLAALLLANHRYSAAERECVRAVDLMRDLCEKHAARHDYATTYAMTLSTLAEIRLLSGKSDDMEELLRKALAIFERVATALPASLEPLEKLATTRGILAEHYARQKRYDDAREHWKQVVSQQRALVDRAPGIPMFAFNYCVSLLKYARSEEDAGRAERALRIIAEARVVGLSALSINPKSRTYRAACMASLLGLIRLHGGFGDVETGLRYLREAVDELHATKSDLEIVRSWRAYAEHAEVARILESLPQRGTRDG